MPHILNTVWESGASRTFWGKIPSTITHPTLPDPLPTLSLSPEPLFVPLPPGPSPLPKSSLPPISPTPSFLLEDQIPPSSRPACHGYTYTPPHVKDRAENNSSQYAPSHMPKIHSPQGLPPCSSIPTNYDPLVSLPPLALVLWNLNQILEWSRMLMRLYHGTPGLTITRQELYNCCKNCRQMVL